MVKVETGSESESYGFVVIGGGDTQEEPAFVQDDARNERSVTVRIDGSDETDPTRRVTVVIPEIEDSHVELTKKDVPQTYTPKQKRYMLFSSLLFFLVPLTTTMYVPAIPTLLKLPAEFGADSQNVAMTMSAFTLVGAISPLLYGPIVDNVGRKTTLIFTLVLYVGASLGCGFAVTVNMLILFRVLQSLGVSSIAIVVPAIMADTVPRNLLGRANSFVAMGVILGPIIGPLIGGLINSTGPDGWRAIFFCLSGIAYCFRELTIFGVEETLLPNANRQFTLAACVRPITMLRNFPLLFCGIAGGCMYGGLMFTATVFPVLVGERFGLSSATVGLLYVPGGVSAFLGTVVSARLGGKLNPLTLAIVGLYMQGTLYIFFPFAREHSPAAFVLCMVGNNFFSVWVISGLQTFCISRRPAYEAGSVAALLRTMQMLGATIFVQIPSSLELGGLLQQQWWFLVVAATLYLSGGPVLVLSRMKRYRPIPLSDAHQYLKSIQQLLYERVNVVAEELHDELTEQWDDKVRAERMQRWITEGFERFNLGASGLAEKYGFPPTKVGYAKLREKVFEAAANDEEANNIRKELRGFLTTKKMDPHVVKDLLEDVTSLYVGHLDLYMKAKEESGEDATADDVFASLYENLLKNSGIAEKYGCEGTLHGYRSLRHQVLDWREHPDIKENLREIRELGTRSSRAVVAATL